MYKINIQLNINGRKFVEGIRLTDRCGLIGYKLLYLNNFIEIQSLFLDELILVAIPLKRLFKNSKSCIKKIYKVYVLYFFIDNLVLCAASICAHLRLSIF